LPKAEAGFWDDTSTGGPATTEGREYPSRQCGNGILPNQYQLELSLDFCLAHEQVRVRALSSPNPDPKLAHRITLS